jgi:hypothetical protein
VEVDGLIIYLVQEPGNSFTGNPALVPFDVSYTDETNALRGIDQPVLLLTRLADLGVTLPEGFTTVIPPGIDGVIGGIDDPAVEGDPAVINMYMNEAFLDGAGGLLADITMLNQIIYTVTQGYDPETLVRFIVNDEPVEAYGTEGLSLVEPVGRATFLDQVNPIIITGLLYAPGVEGHAVLGGRANVFEAALTVRIVDPVTGATLYEEPVMANCGTGCWGDFRLEFNTPLLTTETEVQVFWYSAEDGDPADIVTIPVDEAVTWDLNP